MEGFVVTKQLSEQVFFFLGFAGSRKTGEPRLQQTCPRGSVDGWL
jgi:hypothetical protein